MDIRTKMYRRVNEKIKGIEQSIFAFFISTDSATFVSRM